MVTKEDWKRWRETTLGQRIVEGLGDAIAGNFDRVTIDGQAWVKRDAEIERLRDRLSGDAISCIVRAETGCGYAEGDRAAAAVRRLIGLDEQKAPWPLHHENTCRSLFTHNQKDCDCDQRQEIAQT